MMCHRPGAMEPVPDAAAEHETPGRQVLCGGSRPAAECAGRPHILEVIVGRNKGRMIGVVGVAVVLVLGATAVVALRTDTAEGTQVTVYSSPT